MSHYIELVKFDSPVNLKIFKNENTLASFPHFHKEVEIIYVKKGCVNIAYQNEMMVLDESEIIIFPSGATHAFLSSPDSVRYVYQFDLAIFDEKLLDVSQLELIQLFDHAQVDSKNWSDELVQTVSDLLDKLFQTTLVPTISIHYLQLGYLIQLMGIFLEQLPQETTEKIAGHHAELKYKEDLVLLNQIFSYIETHFQEDITLDAISALVGFSPYYFTRFFKKHIGQTFIQFLSDYRLEQARYILSQERLPMVAVAEKSGFSSVKTFHHVFKKSQGISPLQYQKHINDQ